MSTLYLHVGPHKTGSTYLQELFKDQAVQLKNHGIEYPEIGREYSSAHHNIAWYFADRPLINNTYPQLKEGLVKLSHMEGSDLLLSSEEFARLSPEQLIRLKEAFSRWNFHVIYFLRKGSDFIVSLWQEGIKNGQTTPLNKATLDYLIEDYHYNPLDHDGNIARLKQGLQGVISVIDYNELSQIKQDVLQPVSEIIKADLKPGRKIINPRMADEIIELIRAANLYNAALGKQRSHIPWIACSRTLRVPILSRYLRRNVYEIFKKHHQLFSASTFLDLGYQRSHFTETKPDPTLKYLPEATLLDELNKTNILPWRIIKKVIQQR